MTRGGSFMVRTRICMFFVMYLCIWMLIFDDDASVCTCCTLVAHLLHTCCILVCLFVIVVFPHGTIVHEYRNFLFYYKGKDKYFFLLFLKKNISRVLEYKKVIIPGFVLLLLECCIFILSKSYCLSQIYYILSSKL